MIMIDIDIEFETALYKLIKKFCDNRYESETSLIIISSNFENLISYKFIKDRVIESFWVKIRREIDFGDVDLLLVDLFIVSLIDLTLKHEIYQMSKSYVYIHNAFIEEYFPNNQYNYDDRLRF